MPKQIVCCPKRIEPRLLWQHDMFICYFTWLEQQGVPVEEFEARRDPLFWTAVRAGAELSDEPIDEFNARTGVLETL